jgi:hypothetical protein
MSQKPEEMNQKALQNQFGWLSSYSLLLPQQQLSSILSFNYPPMHKLELLNIRFSKQWKFCSSHSKLPNSKTEKEKGKTETARLYILVRRQPDQTLFNMFMLLLC